MSELMVIQGRALSAADLGLIRRLLETHPDWHRTQLSKELCRHWRWRTLGGQIKDMACRSLLRKLDARGLIRLPSPRKPGRGSQLARVWAPHDTSSLEGALQSFQPIRVVDARNGRENASLFSCLLQEYHYLSYRTSVGETMRYLAFDEGDRPLGCLLFGAAAWKARDRDAFIGWSARSREQNLSLVANNSRFLILPWARIPHLASHLLSLCLRRLSADWEARYNHPIVLVETFVERDRFRGTCYRAANFIKVGQTAGRTRQDRNHSITTPVKDIYVYPLHRRFRERLCQLSR